MGVSEEAEAKAQAAVSQARADVKRLESELMATRTRANLTHTGGSVVDLLTSSPLVHDRTTFLRRQAESNTASAQAAVDRIDAQLISARNELKWALRTLNAVEMVTARMREFLAGEQQSISGLDAEARSDQPGGL